MRKHLALFAALFALALGCPAPRAASSQDKRPESQTAPTPPADEAEAMAKAAEVMKKLRLGVLTMPPEEMGVEKKGGAKVWAVLMDAARPYGVATIMSINDGTASLYSTTGGGVIGGYSVKEQALKFVAEAEKHLSRMKLTESFPYPEAGRVRFYVRTPEGVYTAEAEERELERGRHPLLPLYIAGYEVGGALGRASQSARPKGGQ